jgi:Gas vesicle synthesis protein GvpL/GvpF
VADELARWAAERAPRLLARADEEAVAALRGALIDAALGQRREVQPKRQPPPRKTTPSGSGLWAYGVTRAGKEIPDGVPGVDGGAPFRIEAAGLATVVSRVPLAEFGAEPLRENLNDIDWLERVARAHESVLERALETTTVVPLRLCTIYENDDGVRRMLEDERESLEEALALLDGHQEWGVKVLLDSERLTEEARARMGETGDAGAESGGGAYMLRRRFERQLRETADALATEVAGDVHTRIEDQAAAAVTLPAQNRELSRHEGEMILNAAYLVPADRVDAVRRLVGELEELHRPVGARLELSGPWPPYNFVPRGGAAALA